MNILKGIFESRDKPTNVLSSAYTFFGAQLLLVKQDKEKSTEKIDGAVKLSETMP